MKITKEAFNNLIQIEREAQDEKWGEQRHSDEKWLAILLEELGEAAKAVLEKNEEGLLEETVQSRGSPSELGDFTRLFL